MTGNSYNHVMGNAAFWLQLALDTKAGEIMCKECDLPIQELKDDVELTDRFSRIRLCKEDQEKCDKVFLYWRDGIVGEVKFPVQLKLPFVEGEWNGSRDFIGG